MPWPPVHVYLRGGLKSHGPGLHDYPQFLADWSKLLTERGAIVDGGLHFPTTAELSGVNVIVMYKGDAGYMSADERTTLEAFLKRGGGLVSFHDTLCGDDPQYLANILGAKKHGERNFSAGEIAYTISDKSHPIMQGMSDFKITDEAFFLITKPTLSPEGLHVLATAAMPKSNSAGRRRGSRPADLEGRAPLRPRPKLQGLCLDARPHLHELLGSRDPAHDPARHRLGGQMAGRSVVDREAAAAGTRPWWARSRLAVRGASGARHRDGRGATMARRDNREYRPYLRAEQRRQRGCIARRMQRHLHHGLLGSGELTCAGKGLRRHK